ncbi:NDP-sugar synthase [Candidatus Chloroploca sp. M-50]|uniref:NDP-sugar synthase n=1 Tax=Candidatus Chloroploca mongolica TaxID=2528176 RepID=A0ABS4DH01_9CHLR|nr:NDP-sugar synthase [Candidatus Chloroploca mongolica]MBP1468710.1 NDP-sugar synthase [Candidatus Chloroploca mongolica]
MKAVILVGGLGTRLRPLTCNTPKPMIPLVNQPFIEWMLLRLRDQGISEVVLAVQYLAERFRHAFGDGSRLEMKLHIVEEPEPRGTAGAVKNVEHLLDGPTFIFNGDVMTDLDLRAMLAYHQEKQSKVTIALTPVEDPTQFGLVETERDDRVKRFLEKPRVEDITTNLINAGTYVIDPEVLRYVPPNQFYMFERGLFPVIMQIGDPMYGYSTRAYWTDIGKPQTYIDVHHDILIGKVKYDFRGEQIADRVWVEGDATIHPSAQVVGPVVIGNGTVIGRGARIIGPTVIGPGCQLGTDVSLEGAILWEKNILEEGVTIRNSVLGANNTIGAKTYLTDGAIIGDDCSFGAENRLERGIRIWPGTILGDKAISF